MTIPNFLKPAAKTAALGFMLSATAASFAHAEENPSKLFDPQPYMSNVAATAYRVHQGETILGVYDAIGETAETSFMYQSVEASLANSVPAMLEEGVLRTSARTHARDRIQNAIADGVVISVQEVDIKAEDFLNGDYLNLSDSLIGASYLFTDRGLSPEATRMFTNLIAVNVLDTESFLSRYDLKEMFNNRDMPELAGMVDAAAEMMEQQIKDNDIVEWFISTVPMKMEVGEATFIQSSDGSNF